MIWQDVVITIGSLVLLLALIPTVRASKSHKPPINTSLMYGTTLAIFAYTFYTLELTFTAILAAITSLIWFLLAWQKHKK